MANRSISVTLRANVQDFKAQFDEATKAAERTAKSTEESSKRADTAMGRMVQSAKDNRQAWDTAGAALTGFGASILAVGGIAAKTGIEYNQLQQRAGSALEVLMGSAEAAADQMARLNDFADTSPFSRAIFIEAQQQLIAFGVEAERVVPILSAVQDAVAATGGSNDDISELVRIIAQVNSTGKVTAETLNQLGYRGVDAATLIGEQMGKTGEQIRSEITAGTLDAGAAMQALTDGMSERFGGAAEGMKETFDGAIDRLKAAWRDLSAELMVPLVSPDGGGFLVDLTNRAADALRAIQALPEPIKYTGAALGGLTGAASLAGGAFLLVFPRIMDTVSAFREMGLMSDRAAGRLGRASLAIGKIGLAAGIAAAAFPLLVKGARSFEDAMKGVDRGDYALGLNEITARVKEAATESSAYDSILGDLAETGAINTDQFDSLGEAVDAVANMDAFGKMGQSLGLLAGGMDLLIDRFADADEAMVQLAATDFGAAQASFRAFADEAMLGGATFEDVLEILPGFKDELVGIADAMGLDGTDSAVLYQIAMSNLTPAIDEATGAVVGYVEGVEDAADASQSAADAADELFEKMSSLGGAFIDAERAAMDYAEALADANEAAAENGKHWEDGTEAADANKEAILELADAVWDNATAMEKNGEASGEYLSGARENLIDVLTQMTGNREEAAKYVEQLGLIPEEIQQKIEFDADAARAKWAEVYAEFWPEGGHPPLLIDPEVDPDGKVPEFAGLLSTIPPVDVDADTAPAEAQFEGLVSTVPPATMELGADVTPAQHQIDGLEQAVNDAGGTITINGDTVPADASLSTIMGIINSSGGTVTIDGEDYPAEQALGVIIAAINRSEGTVDVYADTDSAESSASHVARDRSSTVNVNANTGTAESGINSLTRTRYATIQVRYQQSGPAPALGGAQPRLARAMGGPIYGPGTGTSDSVPVAASNGEHMFTAREVDAAGGHQKIYSIRQQLLSGAKTLHLATGGGIEAGQVVPAYKLPRFQPSASAPVGGGGGTTFNNTFHNHNTDAVRATREQVAQFGQRVESMAVPLP